MHHSQLHDSPPPHCQSRTYAHRRRECHGDAEALFARDRCVNWDATPGLGRLQRCPSRVTRTRLLPGARRCRRMCTTTADRRGIATIVGARTPRPGGVALAGRPPVESVSESRTGPRVRPTVLTSPPAKTATTWPASFVCSWAPSSCSWPSPCPFSWPCLCPCSCPSFSCSSPSSS